LDRIVFEAVGPLVAGQIEVYRAVFQSKYYDIIEQKEMLLRVIAETAADTLRVISAYKTSRIEKYWMREEKHESHL
jgi:hypothetical protein